VRRYGASEASGTEIIPPITTIAKGWYGLYGLHIHAKHLDEDTLERYLLRRLTEAELAPVEEQLLVCEECRDRLTELEGLCSLIRMGLLKGFVPGSPL
jgi:hypothetical protein